ncbi:MAG TPA: hypothetical protein VN695_21615 [Streptosporangiaceae bacterium]|nr:hypothetical protein [Streptosporangiaceae bacterium]
MAEPTTGPATARRALDEPTIPVPKRWVAALGLATMGLFMAGLTPLPA